MYHSKAITRGHNQMTCKSASCTKHTTCDFVQKRKKKEVYCTDTVCLFGNLLFTYRKVPSSNTYCLEAHAGLFRLLMKGIFGPYLL